MNLNEIVLLAHQNARDKGFHDRSIDLPEAIALMHSELSEALESARNGEPHYFYEGSKPEGSLAELADVVIRIADYCGSKGWNLERAVKEKMAFNQTREKKHGKVF